MLMDVAPGSAVNAQPDDADFHSNMGNALRQLGKPDAAINGYDEAIKLSPDRVVFHNYRGLALRALNPSSHELSMNIAWRSSSIRNFQHPITTSQMLCLTSRPARMAKWRPAGYSGKAKRSIPRIDFVTE
jgi:tetratricopeptide (TPR) repeat protein